MTKVFEVSFSGLVRVHAKDSTDAWEQVSNEDILDNIELDEIREINEDAA